MLNWLNSWAQGIIVCVIIATIIEMILPQGTIKKYVKVVIGIYILFTIVSPIISKIYGKNMATNNLIDTSKYMADMEKNSNNIAKKIEDNNSKTLKDIFTQNLEEDIKSKLKEKKYNVTSLSIKIKGNEKYLIEQIKLSIEKNEKTLQKNEDKEIIVNKIAISNEKYIEDEDKKITEEEKEKIKKYLENTYGVNSEDILIE